MDAHALLTSQGWRGTGHSLHPTTDSTGLSRPILVSQKQNNLGIGKKQHKTSDMWWMNAFDKSLKGLDTSKQGTVLQTVTSGGLDMVARGGAKFVGNSGGLYASFVRGESLSGTITPEELEGQPAKKRRRIRDVDGIETKEERRARKTAKRTLRAQESAVQETPQVEEVGNNVQRVERKEDLKDRKREKKPSTRADDSVKASSESAKKKKKKRRKE